MELCDRLHAVETIDIASSRRCRLGPDECEFGYRSSAFKEGSLSNHIVTAIEVRLPRKPTWHLNYPGIREALGADTRSLTAKRISDAICALRRAKLPDPAEIGNAGSFFHNPLVSSERLEELQEREPTLPSFPLPDGRFKVPAAWLIERCGWKGYRRGDAGIYQQHALVLVNHGNASGAELWHLAQSVRESVESRFGLRLIPEPRIL